MNPQRSGAALRKQQRPQPQPGNREEAKSGVRHSTAGRNGAKVCAADRCSTARGFVYGTIIGLACWAFLFAAAWAIDRDPLIVMGVLLIALIAYIVLKSGRRA